MSDGEDVFGVAEAVALRLFPDHHALPVVLYVGDRNAKLSTSGWKQLYNEMMTKPTDVSKKDWHEKSQPKIQEE